MRISWGRFSQERIIQRTISQRKPSFHVTWGPGSRFGAPKLRQGEFEADRPSRLQNRCHQHTLTQLHPPTKPYSKPTTISPWVLTAPKIPHPTLIQYVWRGAATCAGIVQDEAAGIKRMGGKAEVFTVRDQGLAEGLRPYGRQYQSSAKCWTNHWGGSETAWWWEMWVAFHSTQHHRW